MFEHGYALLIGVPKSTLPALALPIVAKDLKALSDVLTDAHHCGYLPEHVKVVTDEQATLAGMLAGLDWLKNALAADQDENQTALVYYSGHGYLDEDGAAFLLGYDAHEPFEAHGLAAKVFAKQIAHMQPRRLLTVLDCCHAAAVNVKDAAEQPVASKALTSESGGLERLMQGDARAVLSSSRGEQRSYIRSDGKMSIFTFHLLEALLGDAAGADQGVVTVAQLMDHVGQHVPATAKAQYQAEQVPVFRYEGSAFPVALIQAGKGLGKGEKAPSPLSVVRAELTIDDHGGEATALELTAKGQSVDATATTHVGVTQPGSKLTGAKIDLG